VATSTASPFGVSPFTSTRDLPLGPLHDPWRGLQRTVPNFPPSVNTLPPSLPGLPPPTPWNIKPDPILEQREREAREREERERERMRREREERERREREEKQRRLEQQVFVVRDKLRWERGRLFCQTRFGCSLGQDFECKIPTGIEPLYKFQIDFDAKRVRIGICIVIFLPLKCEIVCEWLKVSP
jgi:hypothetical protein